MEWNPFAKSLVRGLSRLHTSLFRTFSGRGPIARNTLVLTTKGRKTGRETSTPLFYVADRGELYVVASFGGSDTAPGWYRNLGAHPEVKVELGGKVTAYRARTLSSDEAASVWPKLLAMYPAYANYQKRTTRLIPVVGLSATSDA